MILRQVILRHGRSALTSSAKRINSSTATCSIGSCRQYATEIDLSHPMHRQSEQDHRPVRSVPGHPDEASSLLSAARIEHTPSTEHLQAQLDAISLERSNIQNSINAFSAGVHGGAVPVQKASSQTPEQARAQLPSTPFRDYQHVVETWNNDKQLTNYGADRSQEGMKPWQMLTHPPLPEEVSLEELLANQCHLGHATALWHPGNSQYIFGIREGVHIISLEITLSYLRRASKVIEEVARRGGLILFVGTRKAMRNATVYAATRAKGYHIFSHWRPGTLTNGQQLLASCDLRVVNAKDEPLPEFDDTLKENFSKPVLRPDLVVMLNCLENEVCLHECGIYNVPTIGIVDTDVNPSWVTYPIPGNDDSPRSVALIAGVLSRAAQRGQQARFDAAEKGRLTYNTNGVADYMSRMQYLAKAEAVARQTKTDDTSDADDRSENIM